MVVRFSVSVYISTVSNHCITLCNDKSDEFNKIEVIMTSHYH